MSRPHFSFPSCCGCTAPGSRCQSAGEGPGRAAHALEAAGFAGAAAARGLCGRSLTVPRLSLCRDGRTDGGAQPRRELRSPQEEAGPPAPRPTLPPAPRVAPLLAGDSPASPGRCRRGSSSVVWAPVCFGSRSNCRCRRFGCAGSCPLLVQLVDGSSSVCRPSSALVPVPVFLLWFQVQLVDGSSSFPCQLADGSSSVAALVRLQLRLLAASSSFQHPLLLAPARAC